MTESERQKASSEYYSELKKQLDELLKKDAELLKISEKIRNNKANFEDTAKYSEIVSNYIAKVLQENVGNISSPMGKEYVCKELLNAYYSTINDVLGKVQVSVDNQNNIHIRPQQAPFPAERVEQVAHSLEDATVPEEIIKRRSGSSVANVAKSFHDDFIKENSDFRSKSGLKCYITRHSSGNCCKWCSSIAGKYLYKDAPHDVFRRHDNCNCTVTYENGKQRQDVWSKEKWQAKETPKEEYKPVKLNHEQAKAVQQENLQYKGSKNELTSSQNSGIIEESRKNKHVQPINDISIRKVKALNDGAYSNEQNKIIQAKHKELLEFARNNNPNGECAFILSPEFNNQVNCVGKTSSLDFSSREAMNTLSYNRDLYVMHNHPKNSSFSANDIRFLMEHISVKTLSIVKHNGRIEQLTKSPFYNEEKAKEKLRTMFSKYVVSGKDSEIDKAIKEFINSKELFIYEKT